MRFRPHGHGLAVTAIALFLLLLSTPAAAQTPCDNHAGRLADIHTREQLKAFVHCAAAHVESVGWQQAARDFETSAWRDGPVYLFAGTVAGKIILVAGADVAPGADALNMLDADGAHVSRQHQRLARDFGGGYVYYRFNNPVTDREEPKVTWITRVDHEGALAYIGAGYYPQDTHGTCSPDTVRASLVYNERDVERFVTCAEHHLRQHGLRALHDFNSDPRWHAGPTYLILLDMESLVAVLAAGQPHLVGVDGNALRDADGVQFAREKQRVLASQDDGYVYYRFPNPVTGEEEPKSTYVRRVLLDGRAHVLGAGLYVPSAECRHLPLARDIDTRDELQQYVRCARQLVDERGELAWDLFLNHPQWIGGSAYLFVLDELCRQLVYPLDYERQENDEARCNLRDAEDNLLNQDILDTARSEAGEGWVRYLWLNPASDEVEAKHSYVVGGTLDGEHVSIGAGLYESQMQG